MTAVDVVVTGLQKRPISAKVLRVGIREFLGSGMVVDEVMKPENRLGLQPEAGDESKLLQQM